jgi:hypothetical protein
LQLDNKDNIINVFNSKQEAENCTGIKGINNVVVGLSKTAGGYKWKYK